MSWLHFFILSYLVLPHLSTPRRVFFVCCLLSMVQSADSLQKTRRQVSLSNVGLELSPPPHHPPHPGYYDIFPCVSGQLGFFTPSLCNYLCNRLCNLEDALDVRYFIISAVLEIFRFSVIVNVRIFFVYLEWYLQYFLIYYPSQCDCHCSDPHPPTDLLL